MTTASDAKTKALEYAIKIHALANDMRQSEILAALTVTIYHLTVVGAALDGRDPSEVLAKYITVIEEGFGHFLLSHKLSIEALTELAKTLRK